MYWLYVTIVRPVNAWWKNTQHRAASIKLSVFEEIASLATIGAFSTTPRLTLEIHLDLTPLYTLLEKKARITIYRYRRSAILSPQDMTWARMGALTNLLGDEAHEMYRDISGYTFSCTFSL
ncbi:hypothetical protein Trydic_g22639 [Trypoxylus dichotomus]